MKVRDVGRRVLRCWSIGRQTGIVPVGRRWRGPSRFARTTDVPAESALRRRIVLVGAGGQQAADDPHVAS